MSVEPHNLVTRSPLMSDSGPVGAAPDVWDNVGPSVPNSARMYDYYLGGNDNFPVDREAAGPADGSRRPRGLRGLRPRGCPPLAGEGARARHRGGPGRRALARGDLRVTRGRGAHRLRSAVRRA